MNNRRRFLATPRSGAATAHRAPSPRWPTTRSASASSATGRGIYRDYDGPAGAEASRVAIADVGGAVDGRRSSRWSRPTSAASPAVAAAKARE